MRYTIQVDGNLYTVKIEEDPTHKETNETAEDIAYSALLSEYDHSYSFSNYSSYEITKIV